MTYINSSGSPTSQIWFIIDTPYFEQDKLKGFIFSGSYGYVFTKMLRDAGITDYYILSRRPDDDHLDSYKIIESEANQYKPPIIVPLGNCLGFFCPETRKKNQSKKSPDEQQADLEKYSGSILTNTSLFKYPHYIIPTVTPDIICRDWSLRDIVVSLDLGKVKDEVDYFRAHGHLNPLPARHFDYHFDEPGGFERLLGWIERFKNAKLLSVDIETTYPNAKSRFWPHPGIPITVGLADSAREGISFKFFRSDKRESIKLWRELDTLLHNTPLLGQNFFNFDSPRINSFGFSIPFEHVTDTLIRHHILWPELPHKLQFQTRQYTRQPYYKDEGHGWNYKNLDKLMHYNCLDVCVTYEIYEAQEKEFEERPWLR